MRFLSSIALIVAALCTMQTDAYQPAWLVQMIDASMDSNCSLPDYNVSLSYLGTTTVADGNGAAVFFSFCTPSNVTYNTTTCPKVAYAATLNTSDPCALKADLVATTRTGLSWDSVSQTVSAVFWSAAKSYTVAVTCNPDVNGTTGSVINSTGWKGDSYTFQSAVVCPNYMPITTTTSAPLPEGPKLTTGAIVGIVIAVIILAVIVVAICKARQGPSEGAYKSMS